MIEFTEAARERMLTFFAEEEDGASLAVRVSVSNPSPVAPSYEMSLVEAHEIEDCDERFSVDGIKSPPPVAPWSDSQNVSSGAP